MWSREFREFVRLLDLCWTNADEPKFSSGVGPSLRLLVAVSGRVGPGRTAAEEGHRLGIQSSFSGPGNYTVASVGPRALRIRMRAVAAWKGLVGLSLPDPRTEFIRCWSWRHVRFRSRVHVDRNSSRPLLAQ